MSEQESIKRNLNRIKEYGFLRSRNATATLLLSGWITPSGPVPGKCYDHYTLTPEGEALLNQCNHAN